MARRSSRAKRIGPWRGLNNNLSVSAIGDDELAAIVNFGFEDDGSLVSRPPIVKDSEFPTLHADAQLLGGPGEYYTDDNGVTYAVIAVGDTTQLYNIVTKVWTQIWDHAASGWVQYDSKVVLISETTAGGYWEAGVFTSTPTMPLGSDIVFFKERFWAFGVKDTDDQTTVWFSNLTAAGPPATQIWTWTGTDFFTVSKGDGEWITGMIASPYALYIFRSSSTWKFSYNSTPILGTLAQVSPVTGADNKWSFVRYQSYFVVLNNGTLYEFINDYFYPLNNQKVDFTRVAFVNDRSIDTALSLFGDRAIVWFYGAIYVFNLKLRGWATWTSPTTNAARFLQIPQSALGLVEPTCLAVTGGDVTEQKALYRIKEGISSAGEEMSCMIRTKAYDFGASTLKRLVYWDVEFASARGIDALMYPMQLQDNGQTTWNAMNAPDVIWPTDADSAGYRELGTWNNPLGAVSVALFEDDVDFPSGAPLQLLAKFPPAGFARRFYAELYLSSDGTPATAPTRILAMTMYILEKAYAREKVS